MTLFDLQQETDNGTTPLVQSGLIRHFKRLSEQDQLLVQMTCRLGLTHRQVAMVLGISPGTITRRLHRLLQLLGNPLIGALVHPDCTLSAAHREVSLEYLLHRRSIASIARRHRISCRQVYRMIEYTRGWFGARK